MPFLTFDVENDSEEKLRDTASKLRLEKGKGLVRASAQPWRARWTLR